MTRKAYRFGCFIVAHVVIFIVAGSGVLNDLSVMGAIMMAPVWFFGTLFLILGTERALGIGRRDED